MAGDAPARFVIGDATSGTARARVVICDVAVLKLLLVLRFAMWLFWYQVS